MHAFRPWLSALGSSTTLNMGWLLALVSLQWTALVLAVGAARSPSPELTGTERRATLVKVAGASIDNPTPNRADGALPPTPSATPSPPVARAPATTFRAAVHLGNRWLVLHHVMPSDSTGPPTPTEAVLLTGGQVLFVHDDGAPLYDRYTLVNGRSTCHTRAIRRVVVALDTGDPAPDSALGPRWVADQVSGCELQASAGVPLLALSGAPEVKIARLGSLLPQRVRPTRVAEAPCDLGAYDHEFALEVGSAHYEVLRASSDPEGMLVQRDDPGATSTVLEARASLYWDDAGLDC